MAESTISLARAFQYDINIKDNSYVKMVIDRVNAMDKDENIVFYPASFEFRDKNVKYDENAYLAGAELSGQVQDRIWMSIAKSIECELLNAGNGAWFPSVKIDREKRIMIIES